MFMLLSVAYFRLKTFFLQSLIKTCRLFFKGLRDGCVSIILYKIMWCEYMIGYSVQKINKWFVVLTKIINLQTNCETIV